MTNLTRRGFFGFLAAPAIVRATSLMPVRAFLELATPLPSGLLTPSMITKEMLAILENNLIAARKVNRLFGRKLGENLLIRPPTAF